MNERFVSRLADFQLEVEPPDIGLVEADNAEQPDQALK